MRSQIKGPTGVPLLEITIGAHLKQTVERFGEREALVVLHQRYRATYAQLWKEITGVAKGLLALGVKRGDRVGIWAPNRFEWVHLQFATARVGAILVNINPAYKEVELEYALVKSRVQLLFFSRKFRQADFAAMVAAVREHCPELRHAFVIEENWNALQRGGEKIADMALEEREASLGPRDTINIQYTSGTTGFPKGAMLTHRNILNNARFVGQRLRYTERDRTCIPVPFYHCFGMVLGNLACTTHGACMVIPGESFDPLEVLQAVHAERCTALHGVPTMFIAQLEHPRFAEFDLSSLRTGIMAGAPCPAEVLRKLTTQMNLREITVCYGMTETSPVSLQTEPDAPTEKRLQTVGTIHPHVEVKIIDETTGESVARGETGELCTRGYSVMSGYWEDQAATDSAIDQDGWMHTGDLASMDAEGYVRIEGRIKDMIIRGGENIYPREVEEFLHRHPDIAEVYVVGVPSERYGEEVMAWVKLRDGHRVTGEELTASCRAKIATYKIPKYWRFVDNFPMTVTGKVQKFKLREMGRKASDAEL